MRAFTKLGRIYLIGSFLTAIVCFSAFAQQPAELVVLSMEPAPGSEISFDTPLVQIQFQNSDGRLQSDKIFMEVDRSDVTGLVQFGEGSLLYQPPVALSTGEHEVRISGTFADGSPFQEVNWNFKIATSEGIQNWTWNLQPSLTYEYAIRRELSQGEDSTLQSNILINMQRTGSFQTFFNSTLQGNSIPVQGQNEFDMASFQYGLTVGPSSALLGDVVVNLDQLSIANFARRGILLQQRLPFLNSAVDVFSVRTETIFGFKNGLGVSDNDQRTDGASFFFSPLGNERLGIRFYYLHGENAGAQGFNSSSGATTGEKGSAYGASLISNLLQNQLRAEFSSGWSFFDFNAVDEAEGNYDRGFLLRLSYFPIPFTIKNHPSIFQAQVELQDIGLFFRSLGNPFLVSDRRGLNFNSTWTWGLFGLNGGFSKFHDNVKDSPLLPRVNNTGLTAGFSFTPIGLEGPPRLPSFNFNYTRTVQNTENNPVEFLAMDNTTETFASLVAWVRNRLNLNLNASYTKNRDSNNRAPNTDVRAITLAAFYNPTFTTNFGPSISYSKQKTLDSAIDLDLWTYSFTSTFPIFRDVVMLNDQLSYSTTESSDSLNNGSNFSGTMQVIWNLNQTWQNRGTEALSLRVSYNRNVVEAPFVTRQKGLEIFALLSLSWPF